MGTTIVIGGQYGSEGKGKIIGYLAPEFQMCIRTGGPNAGHTVVRDGTKFKLRCIPSAFVNPNCKLAIGAGAVISLERLFYEIWRCNVKPRQLVVDHNAAIIDSRHLEAERRLGLRDRIGSTLQGVGAARADRINRSPDLRFAHDIPELEEFLGDVAELANDLIDSGGKVLIECTQGFGISLYFGHYPFVTSQDITAGTFCGEAGISPRTVDDIILVIRPYPIRVAGNSGPLPNEITWEDVTQESGSPKPIVETTTVTGRVRRVARFDIGLVKRAVKINRPTQIALNFADYLRYDDKGKRSYEDLSKKAKDFVFMIEKETNVPVTLIGTGEELGDIIDLRKQKIKNSQG